MKCPCGKVFDMHGAEEVFLHLPHITAAEVLQARILSANAFADNGGPI
jgi:hypothetical protein